MYCPKVHDLFWNGLMNAYPLNRGAIPEGIKVEVFTIF
jgi:hypothetical protein